MAFSVSSVELLVVVLCAFMAVSQADLDPTQMSAAILIRVDQSGKGDYRKIQDAIDAVPSNNSELVYILIKPGIYKEKITVPADKPFITLSGTKAADTVITGSGSGNIYESSTMIVLASDFVARYLTIQVQQDCYSHCRWHTYVANANDVVVFVV